MSFTQFGYSYPAAPQLLMPSNALSACYESSSGSLLDTGVATSPQNSLYCPIYESRLVASGRHDLISTAVYGNSCSKNHAYDTCSTYAPDSASFYPLGKLSEKDGTGTGVTQSSAYYPYDQPIGHYQYDRYGYGSMDIGTRRKNATRETTSTLKAWLQEHKKNPYPTKGEKIMLAIITKMTLTQVSTWFANARRRLKKENKMTWSPRNKTSEEKECEDQEDMDDSQGGQKPTEQEFNDNSGKDDTDQLHSDFEDFDLVESDSSECEMKPSFAMRLHSEANECQEDRFKEPLNPHQSITELPRDVYGLCEDSLNLTTEENQTSKFYLQQDQKTIETKPKIWSLAQTATSLNQTGYSSCMHKSQETSCSANCDSDITKRKQESPVATLRNWVDGVFHDPLFRHINSNQTFSTSTELWTEAISSQNNYHEH